MIGFNTKKPSVRIIKSGYNPVTVWRVKPEHLPYLTHGANYEYITNWLLSKVLPDAIKHFQPKEKRIKRLGLDAPVEEKIEMLRLVGRKANLEYNKRAHSEAWVYTIHEKYGDYWTDLYNQVKDTPEWEKYREENGIAQDINFGDILA